MSGVMLYRAAPQPNPEIWDLAVEHRVFHGEDVDAALDNGWVRHPRDVAEPEAPTGEDQESKRRGRLPKEG